MANLIKDTMVLVTKDYLKWDWNLLFSFLQHPSLKTTQINEDALFSRCNIQGARCRVQDACAGTPPLSKRGWEHLPKKDNLTKYSLFVLSDL